MTPEMKARTILIVLLVVLWIGVFIAAQTELG